MHAVPEQVPLHSWAESWSGAAARRTLRDVLQDELHLEGEVRPQVRLDLAAQRVRKALHHPKRAQGHAHAGDEVEHVDVAQ